MGGSNPDSIKILVVDDYANWRDLIRTILIMNGFSVDTAATLEEAATLLSTVNMSKSVQTKEYYSFIILDIKLIDEQQINYDGISILKHIRINHPRTKVIVLTGYPSIEQKKMLLENYQISAYFSKGNVVKEIDLFSNQSFIDCINKELNG